MIKNNLLGFSIVVLMLQGSLLASMTEAINAYNRNNFTESYKLLQEVEGLEKNSEQYYYYLGRSSFEIKKYKEAVKNFDKLLAIKPDHTRAKLEKGRALFELKEYKEAEVNFKEASMDDKIPQTVQKNINNYLAAIKTATEKHIVSGAFIAGLGYDTNVVNGNGVLYSDILPILPDTIANSPRSATFHQEILLLNHQYKFEDTQNVRWSTTFLGYNQGYNQNLSANNISLLGLTTGLTIVNKDTKLSLPLTVQKIWVGGNQYLKQYDISPKVDYMYNKELLLSTAVKYQTKRFDVDTQRDSTYKEVSLSAAKTFNKTNMLTASVSYGSDRKEGGTYKDVDKNIRGLTLGYTKQINPKYTAAANYNYSEQRYKELDAVQSIYREDTKDQYSLKATRKINDKISVDLSYIYADTKSTVNMYNYKKSTYLASMLVLF